MPTARYRIVAGSQSRHCCFGSTIVDTSRPEMIGGQHYRDENGELGYEEVCECFEDSDAEMICSALNAAAKEEKQ